MTAGREQILQGGGQNSYNYHRFVGLHMVMNS